MKVEQDIYWTDMHPTSLQEARMNELADACYASYCWAIENLASGKYVITPDTIYDVLDNKMKPDWIEARPAKACPWTMMRYVIREACNNWLDEQNHPDKDFLVRYLEQKHKDRIYIPHTRLELVDTVQIERVCRVKVDRVNIPTPIHLVIAHREDGKWRAEIRAAKLGAPPNHWKKC